MTRKLVTFHFDQLGEPRESRPPADRVIEGDIVCRNWDIDSAKDGKVRAIKENAEPHSESIIDSQGPIDYVLELNGGTAKRLGIRAGNRVESELMDSLRKAK